MQNVTPCFFSSTASNPEFNKLSKLLSPLIANVLAYEPGAAKKAISLMKTFISEIPLTFSKSPEHTKQVINAVNTYLHTDCIDHLSAIARKRKTDRLPMDHAITCDALEYFAFLPMQLQENTVNIHRYLEHMDNILWVLNKVHPQTNWREKLEQHLHQL